MSKHLIGQVVIGEINLIGCHRWGMIRILSSTWHQLGLNSKQSYIEASRIRINEQEWKLILIKKCWPEKTASWNFDKVAVILLLSPTIKVAIMLGSLV